MRLFSFIMIGLFVISETHAAKVYDPYAALECPKLSLKQAVDIIKSGKMVDAIPHYMAFAQPVHPAAETAIDKATALKTHAPFEDADGNVFCDYDLTDAKNNVIYGLSLMPNYGVTEEPAER